MCFKVHLRKASPPRLCNHTSYHPFVVKSYSIVGIADCINFKNTIKYLSTLGFSSSSSSSSSSSPSPPSSSSGRCHHFHQLFHHARVFARMHRSRGDVRVRMRVYRDCLFRVIRAYVFVYQFRWETVSLLVVSIQPNSRRLVVLIPGDGNVVCSRAQ